MSGQPPHAPDGPHLRTVALPRDANPSGDVFGGWTVSQMDLAAGSFCAELAQGRVATIAIEAMTFLRPVSVGDQVSCWCELVERGEHSLRVRIQTWARARGGGGEINKVTEGVFTFVAIDEHGEKRELPSEIRP